MLRDVLPPGAVWAESFGDRADVLLFPEEETAVKDSVPSRRREFATTRGCAHRALAGLGLCPAPLLNDERRAPVWPPGVIGSLTHCPGYRAAAVARANALAVLGIDAEPHRPLPPRVLPGVTLAVERSRLELLSRASPGICWDRVLFSAKESVYKAWFPLMRVWLGFQDAEVTLYRDGTLTARILLGPGPDGSCPTGFSGRWRVAGDLVATAVTRPRYASRSVQPRPGRS
ncbi:4'-phosphopantetheinyl transferase [Streptomyces sp. NPDC001388]|uniref:4'-phosphopantetheinyl transferase family protein n=1 Tax=unclassified Streptomyces TaxID=2593676 RepID=UPI0036BA6945